MVDNPWDAPPLPTRGNRSERVLYEAIGRALSTWEELETRLAGLYAAFCEQSQYDRATNNEYGAPANFRVRLAALERAGCRYFVKRPHQDLEGEFAWLIRTADGWAQRRNDVAHGIVRFLHMVRDPQATLLSGNPIECCLVPPHFREAKYISPDTPAHILTSREINSFAIAFWPIIRRASDLADAVELPQHALRRRFAVPPIKSE
jgi:hypothetical protein